MGSRTITRLLAAAAIALVLGGCTSGGTAQSGAAVESGEAVGKDVVAPVTLSPDALRGAEVELLVGQALNIAVGDLPVDAFAGEVADPAIAEFTPGGTDGSAEFNPGVTALAPGTSEVTLTREGADPGAAEPIVFTVAVTAAE
ncbi:hypothetical protein MUN78_12960 [Leucobacter allii]|uniref:Uncharacterized protein n=1 Tax=Leucobacter allii TaxID=2932247 RepID=A0ABY4FKL6_9MICO|nr:hypothetical protein [Leucobacter allii]UOQ56576.1 hypothetical protein MUN78_12960 [Leucobacter allii]UOR01010.1 hypothetical protein MUN77_12790 [Leucobacter allii]